MKALLLVAATLPSYPEGTGALLERVFPIPFLLVFFSSALLSLACPLIVLTLNLLDISRRLDPLRGIEEENTFKRFILLATTRRVDFEKLKGNLKYFPAEKIVEEERDRRKPLFFVHAEADIDKLVEELEKHRSLFEDGVLASPTMPMLVFLTFGFVLSCLIIHV